MENVIEIDFEIDVKNKMVYIGEIYSSGVEERYRKIDDIGKIVQRYVEIYHKEIKDTL